MASLDDIYDMIKRMEDSDIEYLLITIQKGKKNGKADVFYHLKDGNSMKVLTAGLKKFNQEIDNLNNEDN